MLNDWFYSHPTWEVMIAVCSVVVAIALLGLIPFHRLVDWQSREHDTAMVGLSYALAGGIYAVVLAFVAVGTYESMDKSTAIASDEANGLSSLMFLSPGLPADLASHVRTDIDAYIDIVTKKEWPKQQAYQMDEANFTEGWAQLRRLSLEVANYEPATPGGATVKLEMEHSINDLFSARRARLLAANAHLPDAVWQMLIVGLLLIAFYVYLFGPHNFKIHMAVTTLTMTSIAIVFSLIIALDYPFRGDLSVDDDAYLGVKETAAHVFEHAEGAPAHGAAEKVPEKKE
jgi:hypothetical protein